MTQNPTQEGWRRWVRCQTSTSYSVVGKVKASQDIRRGVAARALVTHGRVDSEWRLEGSGLAADYAQPRLQLHSQRDVDSRGSLSKSYDFACGHCHLISRLPSPGKQHNLYYPHRPCCEGD
jgi:hypothetical protein